LPPPLSSAFSVDLTPGGGELVLGAIPPPDSVSFSLAAGTRTTERWKNSQACLFVNERVTATCLTISFDTGNGVPWIRDADTASIPQSDGLVTPSTRIGFAPPGASTESTFVVAGTSYDDSIKVENTSAAPLTNTGIAAFFGHVVTYDNVHGRILVAEVPASK